MRKAIVAIFFISVLYINPVFGDQDNSSNGDVIIPPGMEVIKEGGVSVVVPKGAQLRKQGSVMLIETADEYASRKFADADVRFRNIEKELETQKNELESQKKEIWGLKNALSKTK